MIQGKWFPQGSDLTDAVSIREAVFGRGGDDLDASAQNAVVYLDGIPAASGRIWWQDGAFWLGEIGVLPAYRGQRLGDLTLRLLLFKATEHFAREVRLVSTPETVGFFARLGFRPSEARAGGMTELWIPGNDIELDACKACRKKDCPNRSASV